MKSFCASKDTMKKVNTQPTYWKKICANCLSDKEFVCRIQKDFFCNSQLNNRRQKSLFLKWARDLNKHFSKKYIQMANKPIKKFSTPLAYREMQTKPQ